ncbi:MAG: pyridoxamine 5'-phosphate oxidase family protein [Deltaproteobacteria bacterium]|nr:pyridoxamine 5'-phosphate oxidase family protein [Deltaproteobacteria bacterium]
MNQPAPPMRREVFRMADDDARAFLRAAPFVQLAGCAAGRPVLKTVNVVELDGAWYFHGAVAGEKTAMLAGPVVLAAEELVAQVPSTFVDDERACFASALYRSVQLHGALERVDDAAEKARALHALMVRFQPEGGFRPITHDDPLYAGEVKGVLVARVLPERIDGKAKLAQNKQPHEVRALLERLWRRGEPGDARAVALIAAANPAAETPAFLQGPAGVRLCCAMEASQLDAAVTLHGAVDGAGPDQIRRRLVAALAWAGAVDHTGALVASAHLHLDRARGALATIVAIAPAWRTDALVDTLTRLLRDHPAARAL